MISKLFDISNPWKEGEPVLDFNALESLDEVRPLIEKAMVIGYKCTKSNAHALVFGLAALQAIRDGVMPPQKKREGDFLIFALDSRTHSLELLCAMVKVVKGCYENHAAFQLGGAR